MIPDKLKNILHRKKPKPKRIRKPKQQIKSRQTIESRGLILMNQLKETDSNLKEFSGLDFLSEQEEQNHFKLVIEREKLKSQIKILSWVLEGENNV